ncbi:MAG: alpha-ketoglutarate-dependent dioxygenase AlkB [Pseudomonadota bacterium]
MQDLFASQRREIEPLGAGLVLLPGFADTTALLEALPDITAAAPFRQQQTPGGKTIAVSMTNCGALGWVSDRRGYRYQDTDPVSGERWPPLPESWSALATHAAALAGCPDYTPNVCLVNRYLPGQRLSSHQDLDERDFSQPVVTVSSGLPATFLVHGETRGGKPHRLPLVDGDVLVMGGASRRHYHAVDRIAPDPTGRVPHRISLTFRAA